MLEAEARLLRGGRRCDRTRDTLKAPGPLGVFVTWSGMAVAKKKKIRNGEETFRKGCGASVAGRQVGTCVFWNREECAQVEMPEQWHPQPDGWMTSTRQRPQQWENQRGTHGMLDHGHPGNAVTVVRQPGLGRRGVRSTGLSST